MTKLNWTNRYGSSSEERAIYRGLRIRAVLDACPRSPLDEDDGHWPMLVQAPGNCYNRELTSYANGSDWSNPVSAFSDTQLVHDQRAIAKLLGGYDSIGKLLDDYCWASDLDEKYGDDVRPNYCQDADLLRDAFNQAFEDHVRGERDYFDNLVALYKLAGIRTHNRTVRGYCQGDWAEVLVIAPPDQIKEFGICIPELEMQAKADPELLKRDPKFWDGWVWDKVNEKLMDGQAELYGDWAFGNCYGYVLEAPLPAENDEDHQCKHCGRDNTDYESDPCLVDDCPFYEDDEAWLEISSCWGFFGTDHAKSGLEEAAVNAADCHLASEARQIEELRDAEARA